MLWDARRQLACIARHGLNLCQIRGPECVERYRLGYYTLRLRDTRVLLRDVHYPFKGPSERAKLGWELECVDIACCFIDFGYFNAQPFWRTGDQVLMPKVRTWRKNAGSPKLISYIDGARLSDCFRGLATICALEPVSGAQHRPVKLVVHVQPLTSCCYKWFRGKHFLVGFQPSLHVSCVNARGLLVGDRGPNASVWSDCGGGIGWPDHARKARTSAELMRSWRRFLTFSENSKAAIAKWKGDMKKGGLAARWVKSRSIVGVDLQHHVNWADEDHFEQCIASVPLVPRATHLATAKELVTRWNTGVDELDRDLPGVQLS